LKNNFFTNSSFDIKLLGPLASLFFALSFLLSYHDLISRIKG
jgi:hypothetical protein